MPVGYPVPPGYYRIPPSSLASPPPMAPLTPYPPAPLTIDPFDNPVEPTPDELKLLEDLRIASLPDPPDEEGEAKYPQKEEEEEVKNPLAVSPQSPDDIKNEVNTKMEELSNEIAEIIQPQLNAFIEGRPRGPKRDDFKELTPEQFKEKRIAWNKQHKQQFKDNLAAYKNKLENSKDVKDKIRLYNLLNDSLLKDDNEKLRVLKLVDARPVIATTVQAKLRQEINDIEEDINLNPLPETIAFIKLLNQRRLQDPSIENATIDREYQAFLFKNDPRKQQQELLKQKVNDKRFLDEATARQVASLATAPSVVNDDAILDILKASNISPPKEEVKEEEEKYPQGDIAPISKKQRKYHNVRVNKYFKGEKITEKDVKEDIQRRIDEAEKQIESIKKQAKRMLEDPGPNKWTMEQGREFLRTNVPPLLKKIHLLKKGLEDDENIKRIVASSNFEVEEKTKRMGKEYEQELIKKKREELKQLNKVLIIDPENPNRKIIDPSIVYLDSDGEPEIENNQLDKLNEDGFNRNRFTTRQQINNFIQNNNINIIDNEDKYMLNNIVYNAFYTNEEYGVPIIFDILYRDNSRTGIAEQQIDSLLFKYWKKDDSKFNMQLADNISALILKDLLTKYYINNEKSNIIKYSNYIIDLVDDMYNHFDIKNYEAGYYLDDPDDINMRNVITDVKEIPNVTKLKNIFDKINTKRITINDKLEVAKIWNSIFSKNLGFTKIWTYLGLDKNHYFGKYRGTNIYEKIFLDNPYYSEKHKLFAIEGLEALKNRENILKNYAALRKTFTERNQAVFDEKGKNLTAKEAKKMFDKIINALNEEDLSKLREKQYESSKEKYKKGSGISKKRILKYLKGKSSISKPTVKGLDTEIFNILNS